MKISDRKKQKIENGFRIRPNHLGRRPINENATGTGVFPVFSLVFLISVPVVPVVFNILYIVNIGNRTCRISYLVSCIAKPFCRFYWPDWPDCVLPNVFVDEVASQYTETDWPEAGQVAKWV